MDEGIALARNGDRAAAQSIFRQIIRSTPESEDAWLWLAGTSDDAEQSLQLLEEAQAFLPDSERIAEAVRQARQQLGPASESLEDEPPQRASARRDRTPLVDADIAKRVADSARGLRDGIERAYDGATSALSGFQLPQPGLERLRPYLAPVGTLLITVLLLSAIIWLGISSARRQPALADTWQVPTPDPRATATPTLEQLCEPLWVKANVTLTREDWEGAIEALHEIRRLEPSSREAREKLAEAYHQRGLALIGQNALEQARDALDTAIRLSAGSEGLQETRRTLRLYMDGLDAYYEQDWRLAVNKLDQVYGLDPGFRDVRTMLGQANYRLALRYIEEERWEEARDALKETSDLTPELEDAKKQMTRVMDVLIPPRRIEVDLSDKITVVYEDHKPIYRFRVCIGRPSAPTLPGRYQVLDKLPMAYASKWDLNMPWWLGIYWAGGSQNGFHALPILSNGNILWSGALGTGCSFGCIVLDTKDAITLYNWAEIGTVVLISP